MATVQQIIDQNAKSRLRNDAQSEASRITSSTLFKYITIEDIRNYLTNSKPDNLYQLIREVVEAHFMAVYLEEESKEFVKKAKNE